MFNIKRKTKIKIRKALSKVRAFLLIVFGVCLFLTVCSVDGESLIFPIVCFGIGVVCFGISYAIDWLLVETAWSGDSSSLYYH